jgi:predicted nucleic acid-binding protein
MEPILVDTTVWIDWFWGIDSAQTNRVALYLMQNYPLWIAPVILQETLQGIRNDQQYEQVKTSLLALNQFSFEPFLMAAEAAHLYRTLRKQGITIRKANDCLIAQYALKANMILLHNDSDFDLIASETPLKASRF